MKITLNNLQDIYKAKKASVDTMELKGYELKKEFFVDSSGFGADNEPALTGDQFDRELYIYIRDNGSHIAKITGVGQFQVYVGLFLKTGKSRSKIIANNTLKITNTDGSTAIRLHDTDILTFKDNRVTLNSGGWKTKTTKDRMNTYLPNHIYIMQKDYEWYVINRNTGNKTEFIDGMRVTL